ncbi:unnamed protein product [Ixodes persulcatus]
MLLSFQLLKPRRLGRVGTGGRARGAHTYVVIEISVIQGAGGGRTVHLSPRCRALHSKTWSPEDAAEHLFHVVDGRGQERCRRGILRADLTSTPRRQAHDDTRARRRKHRDTIVDRLRDVPTAMHGQAEFEWRTGSSHLPHC